MRNHRDCYTASLGGSDIAEIIVQTYSNDGICVERLPFGSDGEYWAYIADMETTIPDYYTEIIAHNGSGWFRIFDDERRTLEMEFMNGIRIFRAGERGCIIRRL